MNIFTTDYEKLENDEKKNFYSNFSKYAEESFEKHSEKTQILAQLLFLNRVYNTYNKAIVNCKQNTSLIMNDAVNILWDYLEGKCSIKDVEMFGYGINAFSLYINIGDTSEIEENAAFRDKYSDDLENSTVSIILFNSIASLFFQICEESFDWYSISEDCILGEIREIVFEYFMDEDINENELYEEITAKICCSKIFNKVISYLLNDIRQAVDINENDNCKIEYLRKQYQNENILSDSECEKLKDYFM